MSGQGALELAHSPADEDAAGFVSHETAEARARMAFVLRLRERGIAGTDVLRALETVPRELFVPHRHADLAWRDVALPIACGQTMPAPVMVAMMMEALAIKPDHRVMEIGSGSGYTTAILARLAGSVQSFEHFRALALEAERRLAALAIDNAAVAWADGLAATLDKASWDRIVIHAAIGDGPDALPPALCAALTAGGRIMYARAGKDGGQLICARRDDSGAFVETIVTGGRFSALLTGRSQAL